MRDFLMTSASATAGHPDKLCDQVSDAVVDAWLADGVRRPVTAECALASGVAFLSIRADMEPPTDAAALARRVMSEAGYASETGQGRMTVILDLAAADDAPLHAPDPVARHMVTAIGYACDSTESALPAPIHLAHRISRALDAARQDGALGWLSPDAQAQVAVRFVDRRPASVEAVALTVATTDDIGHDTVSAALRTGIVDPVLASCGLPAAEGLPLSVQIRPGTSGPTGHTGLTGRKTADDGYGAFVRQSGSALSGKDPSRIDRIADYAARHAALGVVAAGLARECEVQLSYLPGAAAPYDIECDTSGSGRIPDRELRERLTAAVDFRLAAIADRFRLWDLPSEHGGRFYQRLAVRGQVGRTDLDLPWEARSLAADLA